MVLDAWGKYESPDQFHRLEHHCADVAACFEALLRDPVLHDRFERAAGCTGICEVTKARLTVIAFLHDFGKVNTGFQFKVRDDDSRPNGRPRKAGHIGEALWCFEQERLCDAFGLSDMDRCWGEGFVSLLLAALAHHGRPAKRPSRSGSGPGEFWEPFGGYDPLATAKLLGERCRAWFPEAFSAAGPALPDSPALAHFFAGVVALADQIGSDREFFPFEPAPASDYIERARERAQAAVQQKGFGRAGRPGRARSADFRTLFGHEQPRPLQKAVQKAPLDYPLMILESETGSGKTEAAIVRFAALWRAGLVDGLYFALPTRAAAKQIHARVCRALSQLFPAEPWAETILAIPGYLMAGTVRGWPEENFKVYWEDEPDEEIRHARWSAEASRKFLGATAAVGTVDQALLAGLQVKWAHYRGAALARNLLVVDEAHASDAYMTGLLHSVLRGHLAAGGHALLMSATLGAVARTAFVTDESRWECLPTLDAAEKTPYPAITVADGHGQSRTSPIDDTAQPKMVSMRLEPTLADPERIASAALAEARIGAKVLVIRNTVTSAQAVFASALEQGGASLVLQAGAPGGPALHHSRFAAEDRALLDDCVERELGKGRRPGGCVVIGTQTLEQSLDIDADVLFSDLCPVDVLLQRIGRLHRHRETERRAEFAVPRCVVLSPAGGSAGLEEGIEGGLLRHGLGQSSRGGGVYRNLLSAERTRRLVEDHSVWTIPDMNRMLVEHATHPEALGRLAEELGGAWAAHEQDVSGAESAEAKLSQWHSLDRRAVFDEDLRFLDQDENVRTRLGEDGPRIVLAEAVPGPYGQAVRTFNFPRHLFRGVATLPSKAEIDASHTKPTADGLILHVGDHTFRYDRTGISTIG